MTSRWSLRRHDLRIDAISDVSDRKVWFTPGAVSRALAGQASPASASQVRRYEVRFGQMVSTLADVDAVSRLRGDGVRERGTLLYHRSLSRNERRRCNVKVGQKSAHATGIAGAFVLSLEPVADHTRRDSGRSVSRSAQRAFPPVMRSAQRAVRVLRVESGVVRRPLGGQPQQLRWYVHPQRHFDSALTGLVGQFARRTCECAPSSNVDCVVRGLGLSRRSAASVAVDPASEPPRSEFVSACSVSAGEQCSAVAANPWLPTSGAAIVHTSQSIVKLPQQQAELPWHSGKRRKGGR